MICLESLLRIADLFYVVDAHWRIGENIEGGTKELTRITFEFLESELSAMRCNWMEIFPDIESRFSTNWKYLFIHHSVVRKNILFQLSLYFVGEFHSKPWLTDKFAQPLGWSTWLCNTKNSTQRLRVALSIEIFARFNSFEWIQSHFLID